MAAAAGAGIGAARWDVRSLRHSSARPVAVSVCFQALVSGFSPGDFLEAQLDGGGK